MSGERRIAASRKTVWAALNDPRILKQCIPGCETLEKLSPTDMIARVKLQIGPVKATFNGKVKLTDLDPPNGYRISGKGSGGGAGYAKSDAVIRLADDSAGTLVRYDVKAVVGGNLAQLWGRLIDSTAEKLADEFFEKFTAIVGGAPAGAGAPSTASSKGKGWFKRWFFRRKMPKLGRSTQQPIGMSVSAGAKIPQ